MLELQIPGGEFFNEQTMEFIRTKPTTLKLEHSLVSLSKWESKWKKPFLTDNPKDKTKEQIIDYIRFMTLNKDVDPEIYSRLTQREISQITAYIEDPMTATWFSKKAKGGASKRVVTAELIYYWMVAFNIPFECQKWHLNRLITLIRVCNEESQPRDTNKKMTQAELQARARLNAERRARLKTKG